MLKDKNYQIHLNDDPIKKNIFSRYVFYLSLILVFNIIRNYIFYRLISTDPTWPNTKERDLAYRRYVYLLYSYFNFITIYIYI